MEQRQFSLRSLLAVVSIAGLLFGIVRAVPGLPFALALCLTLSFLLSWVVLCVVAVCWLATVIVGTIIGAIIESVSGLFAPTPHPIEDVIDLEQLPALESHARQGPVLWNNGNFPYEHC